MRGQQGCEREEENGREGEGYTGYDRNITNRKLVSTAEETTSLRLVTTFVSHSLLLLLPLSLSSPKFSIQQLQRRQIRSNTTQIILLKIESSQN